MRVFDFTNAIVRAPAASVVHGLRSVSSPDPDFEKLRAEHQAYVSALQGAGLQIDLLPPLDAFADSIFVEDPAFVVPQGAILLRPGAPTRLGEREHMRDVLKRRFGRVQELADGEYADGGDVLITPKTIFIGLSRRTNRAGAEALQAAHSAAAIMAMNNIYYRFIHLASAPDYKTLPAKLRMSVIGKPGVEKADFELWCLAVSAINGCGMCIDAHEKVLREHGMTAEQIQAAVRIASVVHAVSATLDGVAADPGELNIAA